MSNLSNIIVQLKDSQSTFLEKLQVIESETENASEEILRDLIQDAREIHEGTVLLSYLVYNQSNETEEDAQPEIAFEEDPEEELLISALESAIENTQKDIERTMDEPEIVREINDVKAIIEAVEEVPEQDELTSELESSISDMISSHSSEPVSVNPIETEDNSLAAKLGKKKIDNLVTSVGINEKFLFTNELFEGNTEQFIKTINELNNLASFEEANGYLSNLVAKKNWETEEAPYLKLLALVERKYL